MLIDRIAGDIPAFPEPTAGKLTPSAIRLIHSRITAFAMVFAPAIRNARMLASLLMTNAGDLLPRASGTTNAFSAHHDSGMAAPVLIARMFAGIR
jgi:hypothetical protein